MAVNSAANAYVPTPGTQNAPGSYLPQAPLPQAPGFGPAAQRTPLLHAAPADVAEVSASSPRFSPRRESIEEDGGKSDSESEEDHAGHAQTDSAAQQQRDAHA